MGQDNIFVCLGNHCLINADLGMRVVVLLKFLFITDIMRRTFCSQWNPGSSLKGSVVLSTKWRYHEVSWKRLQVMWEEMNALCILGSVDQ